jgi:hypothetical protein
MLKGREVVYSASFLFYTQNSFFSTYVLCTGLDITSVCCYTVELGSEPAQGQMTQPDGVYPLLGAPRHPRCEVLVRKPSGRRGEKEGERGEEVALGDSVTR